MPKQIISDVFGEILETGKATAKAAKTVVGMEKSAASQREPTGKVDPQLEEKKYKEQIERMSQIDKKQSRQAYEEIQRQIRIIQQQKESQPRRNVSGATGFDDEQIKSPETFWDKIKKKKEKMAKNLPWTSKQGMGTGEIRRGTSG